MHSPFNDESVPVCFATGQNGKEAERLNKFIWLRIGWLLDQGDEDGALALMMELSLIHTPSPRDKRQSRMPSSA